MGTIVAGETGQDRKAAFLSLFEEYAPALERLAGCYTGTREDREDMVQEIAAALWKALPQYRGEASRRTWLYRIAHNVAITASVKVHARERREVAQHETPDISSPVASAEQDLLAEERRHMLLHAVRALSLPDRQIAVMHMEGLSGAEIEEVTGILEGAIATRLTRIREKLRRAIRAQEAGDAQ